MYVKFPGQLSGICHFVLEKLQMLHSGAGRPYKYPPVGLKKRVQMPHPGDNTKVNKLQIPYLWVISNNLIKAHEVPYANRPLSH